MKINYTCCFLPLYCFPVSIHLRGSPPVPHGLLFSCFFVASYLQITRGKTHDCHTDYYFLAFLLLSAYEFTRGKPMIATRTVIFLLFCCFPLPAPRGQHYRLPHAYDIFEFFVASYLQITRGKAHDCHTD